MLASDATAGTEPISAAARTEIKAVALAAQGHHEEADKLFHAAADADLALSHRIVPTLVRIASRVTLPTLLVQGGQSDIVDDDGVEEMRRLVPQTEILEVGGASHMVAGDRNDAFNRGVIDFLERHMPTA